LKEWPSGSPRTSSILRDCQALGWAFREHGRRAGRRSLPRSAGSAALPYRRVDGECSTTNRLVIVLCISTRSARAVSRRCAGLWRQRTADRRRRLRCVTKKKKNKKKKNKKKKKKKTKSCPWNPLTPNTREGPRRASVDLPQDTAGISRARRRRCPGQPSMVGQRDRCLSRLPFNSCAQKGPRLTKSTKTGADVMDPLVSRAMSCNTCNRRLRSVSSRRCIAPVTAHHLSVAAAAREVFAEWSSAI